MTNEGVTQAQRETLTKLVAELRAMTAGHDGYVYEPKLKALDAILRDHARLTEERELARVKAGDNPLQFQLLDLITLMPDSQTQDIIDYIMDLRAARKRRDE
jgi:hypothetical protein